MVVRGVLQEPTPIGLRLTKVETIGTKSTPNAPRGLEVRAPPTVGDSKEESEPLVDIIVMSIDPIEFDTIMGAFKYSRRLMRLILW